MARLSKEELARLRKAPQSRPRGEGSNLLGTLGRGIDRAVRLGGLAAGTAVGAVSEWIPGLNKWTPDVYSSTPEAFKAFWDNASQGDWDAAIEAYQDEMKAGPGFWGAAELAGSFLPTGGPAFAGTKLISAAPKLAGTLGARGEGAAKLLGRGLRAPWLAEEKAARGAIKGLGLAARTVRHPMTGPLSPARILRGPGPEDLQRARDVDAVVKAPSTIETPKRPTVTPVARAGVTPIASDAMIEEAKKFKTAESFVESMYAPLSYDMTPGVTRLPQQKTTGKFHGTNAEAVQGILSKGKIEARVTELDRAGQKSVSVSGNRATAGSYGTIVFELDPKLRVYEPPAGVVRGDYYKGFELRHPRDIPLSSVRAAFIDIGRSEGLETRVITGWKRPGEPIYSTIGQVQRQLEGKGIKTYVANFADKDGLAAIWNRANPTAAIPTPQVGARLRDGKTVRVGRHTQHTGLTVSAKQVSGETPADEAFELIVSRPDGRGWTVLVEFEEAAQAVGIDILPKVGVVPPGKLTMAEVRNIRELVLDLFPRTSYMYDIVGGRGGRLRPSMEGIRRRRTRDRRMRPTRPTEEIPTVKGRRVGEKGEGPATIPDLREVQTLVDIGTSKNVGRVLAQVPLISHIMRRLNPAALADTPEARAVLARNVLHFEAKQLADAELSVVRTFGTQEQVLGKLDEKGLIAEGPLQGKAPNAVRSDRKKPYIGKLLTEKQQAWLAALQDIEQAKLALFRRYRIKIDELTFTQGGEYAGRRTKMGKIVDGELVEVGFIGKKPKGVAGKKMGQQKVRPFATQKEALDAGFRYLDEDVAVYLNLKAAYKRIADKKFADWVIEHSPHLRRVTKARPKEISGEVNAYKELYGNIDFEKVYFKTDTPAGAKAYELLSKELDATIPKLSILRKMGQMNAVVRYMELNADMGQFMIQLLYLAGSKPHVWGKAIRGYIRSWSSPTYHDELLSKHKPLLEMHRDLMTTRQGTEVTEAIEKGGLLHRLPKGFRYLGFHRFARAFNTAMDEAGIELAKSLDNTLRPKTAKEFADIDAFINEIRGLASSAKMGVSPTMRAVENSLLLAPRYNRAIAALLWDTVADSGLRGELARSTLARSVGGLVAVTSLFKMAEYFNKTDPEDWTMDGMEEHVLKGINPTSPEFFTFEVGGTNIGPGTKVRSLVKLYADSLTEPGSLLELGNRNPFIRFARGSAAPMPSDAWDMFTGHNYMGDPTGIFDGWEEGFVDNIKKAGQEVVLPDIMPIWVHSVLLEGGGAGQRASRGVVEFFGGRAYPMSRPQMAQEIATREGLGDYETLDARPKSLVDKLATQQYKESGREIYTGKEGPKRKERDDADDDLVDDIRVISEKYLAAPVESAEFAPRLARLAYNDARREHRGFLYGVKWDEEKQRTVGGLLEEMYDMDQEREEPEEGTKDHRLWQYGQTFNESIDPETGKLDFETLDKLQSKFWASLTITQASEMLRNIRVLEGEYDNRAQRMIDAGRYAGSLTLTLAGEDVGYYDLEDHKLVEAYISQVTGVSIIAIQEYLDKTIPERDAARKSAQGELIGKALDKAARKNGILWKLRKAFVTQAPAEWRQGMLDAGYSYQGKSVIEKDTFAKLKAGRSLPERDYKQLYRQALQPVFAQ